jgi:hypothetical protein
MRDGVGSSRMAEVSTQLDYAQAPAWRRRKVVRRGVIAGAVLLALLASLKFAGPAWNHARLLHYQKRCLVYAESGDRIVFDEAASRIPVASDWDRFYTLFSPPGGRVDPIVFLHELRRKDGSSRLVAVQFSTIKSPTRFTGFGTLESTVVELGGFWRRPQLRGNSSWNAPCKPWHGDYFHLHFGQIDAANSSHFTIAITYGEYHSTIDGWLQEDDNILLELRDRLPMYNQ